MLSLPPGLIVSCQAPIDSPLHNPLVIAAMAQAAVNQGAIGVRIDTPAHVAAVRSQVTVPVIGLWKQQFPNSDVYITPQLAQAEAIAAAGADIIAIDATQRPRPGGEIVTELIAKIHGDLGKWVMADIDTLESAIEAARAGADVIGTTLYGYTEATRHLTPPGFDLLQAIVAQVKTERPDTFIICEGGIASPAMAQQAIAYGADAVVVGTAITGIDLMTKAYCVALSTLS